MSLQRVRCLWSGWPGQPGYTNFYTSISIASVAPFVTFFNTIKGNLPSGLTITVPGSGDIVNTETGLLSGVWSAPGNGAVTGSSVGNYAGPAGCVVEWLTQGIVAGRRVLGKTYIVPLAAAAFQNDGTISEAEKPTFTNAAAALVTALGNTFLVWSRPFTPGPNNPPVGQPGHKEPRAGTAWPVIGSRFPDMAAVMRSRRT